MSTDRTSAPITRAAAGTCIGWMVAAAGLTILITRLYLLVTGYPQVGGDIFHIAHAVWGGLLLMIGLSVAMALANRWAAIAASIVGGIGAGLFIDEIGKFVTKDNDYFFPLAAPLAYAVLAAFGYFGYRAGSSTRDSARGHLYAALDMVKPALDGALTQRQIDAIRHHLRRAEELGGTAQTDAMATGLLELMEVAEKHVVAEDSTWFGRMRGRLRDLEERLVPLERARLLARLGLGIVAVAGVLGGAGVLAYSLWQLFGPAKLPGNSLLGQSPGAVAWTSAAIASGVSVAAGVMAVMGIRRLRDKNLAHDGTRWGIAAMALLLGGVNILTSYFSQFIVLLDASVQACVLGLLLRLQGRTK